MTSGSSVDQLGQIFGWTRMIRMPRRRLRTDRSCHGDDPGDGSSVSGQKGCIMTKYIDLGPSITPTYLLTFVITFNIAPKNSSSDEPHSQAYILSPSSPHVHL